jgi:predicted nucleotidyltransferase
MSVTLHGSRLSVLDRRQAGGRGSRMVAMACLEALANAVEPIRELRLVVLFGSAATLREHRDSDLDVGVLVGGDGELDLGQLRVLLERATGRIVDLVRLDSAPPLLRMEVARHGRLVLERDPQAWASFRAHAMIDWWDWAPTARLMHETAVRRLREEAASGPS